ncbi:primary-amine oxidase [Mycolicibacterium sp. 624]|uniref:primary-amine oxidase n=1 Tax=Mycolicibacterium sp. 624 TaxID=3156314 RepID=UPI00339B2A94
MTALDERRATAPTADVLASLTAEEIDAVRTIVSTPERMGAYTRFVYVGLIEPPKHEVLAYEAGTAPCPPRIARVMLLDLRSGLAQDLRVDLTAQAVVAEAVVDGADGHVPMLIEENDMIVPILQADETWRAAMSARGLDPDKVMPCGLSAGHYGHANEHGRRVIRCLGFYRESPDDMIWARPVDGVCAYVDTVAQEVIEVVDDRHLPVPEETTNFHQAEYCGPTLNTLKPIEITQPEGPSFTVDGASVEWANWKFRVSFDAREGLILRQLTFTDGGVDRPVLYRASIAEMVVPYADPSPTRYWQNYFDTGEYLFGRFTNSLKLGCDCLGDIHYFDAALADESGNPQTITNAICMHEEDFGTLWKHTDHYTKTSDVRRSRRLVISSFTTVGNYDYGFYWYLYLDGTIECEAKLTGVLFPSSYPGTDYPYASEVGPGVGAPYHQHMFCARLDMMVDGVNNSVVEIDAKRVPMGPDNPWGNAFTNTVTPIASESEGGRLADSTRSRTWHVINKDKTNRLDQHPAYALYPHDSPTMLADENSSISARANYATKHLWVTAYDPEERYPAGDLVNQHPGGAGLPQWMANDRNLEQADVVLWHAFAITHFPRPEDWPVMPVDYVKFALKPHGFFDRSPVLNIPKQDGGHCNSGGADSCH